MKTIERKRKKLEKAEMEGGRRGGERRDESQPTREREREIER
jgi:hypothetical protein